MSKLNSLTGRIWVLVRHADVRSVLLSDDFVEYDLPAIVAGKRNGDGGDFSTVGKRLEDWLFFIGGSQHQVLRRALLPIYSPKAVERLRERVTEFVRAAFRTTEKFDFVAHVAWPLPAVATAALLDLPIDPTEVTDCSSSVLKVFEPLQRLAIYQGIEDGFGQLDRLFDALPEATIALTRLGAMLGAALPNLTPAQQRAIAVMLFAAGQDTVASALTNMITVVFGDPGRVGWLRERPSLIASAVKEVLRFEPPVQMVARVARVDSCFEGVRIAAGERLCLALGAANRDELEFANPNDVDFERTTGTNLAFGAGQHYCIGTHLTSMVLQATMAALMDLPAFSLEERQRRPSFVFRGYSELQIKPSNIPQSIST
ncbi:cytochrome P450 [Caulobacter sp. KR2-114]|uniref:cytochrome P450 n=1 Tax=Caulobacter sp. KR2-114 TaxID=3400912 RepID=UPI003C094AB1